MAKVGVAWLEPERDVGKTTFIAVRDLTCDRTRDLPAGTVVLAKWRSSGRSYKARLLSNVMAKKAPKRTRCNATTEKSNQNADCEKHREIPNLGERSSKGDSNARADEVAIEGEAMETTQLGHIPSDSDSEDDIPLITRREVYSSECSGNCNNVSKATEAVQREVNEMKLELLKNFRDMKEYFQREISQLKSEVLYMKNEQAAKNNEIMNKLDTIMNTMSVNRKTTEETLTVIKGRIHAKTASKPRQDVSSSPNFSAGEKKRTEPAFGQFEGNNVVAYSNGRNVLSIDREKYTGMFEDAKTSSSFLRKLLRHAFSDEELAESNFNGGEVTSLSGLTEKKCLDREVMLAIFAQVELEFPGSTRGKSAFGKLREATNAVCRGVAHQLRK